MKSCVEVNDKIYLVCIFFDELKQSNAQLTI